jgi:7,8-dihydropterin-6-yl-methyl-4-(beta-D-ribofuranosyl)aminobenzene 5'-phosphate synthase
MSSELRLTLLIEDSQAGGELAYEHGLSFWIGYAGKNILFDTGQSGELIRNAQKLGIDLAAADAIVLSHGHYDHTGGLADVLETARDADIYMHPAAVKPKFGCKPQGAKFNGMSPGARAALSGRNIIRTEKPVNIVARMSVTGEVPRITGYEDTGGAFFTDSNCLVPDNMPDDQSIFIDTGKGLVVLLGCAHSGVVNILEYISKLTGRKKVHAVIGGMHLLHADRERIDKTIQALKKFAVEELYPLHCTGADAVNAFRKELPGRFRQMQIGQTLNF